MDKLEIENKSFIEAIELLKKKNTQEAQSVMLGEMMNAKFLNPTTLKIIADENGKISIPMGQQVSFYTIVSTNKKKYAIAFTDDKEMSKWIEANLKSGVSQEKISRNSVIMGFMDYASIVLGKDSDLDGFVINPYNHNLVFNREQIFSLKEQKINQEQYGISKRMLNKNEMVYLKKLLPEEYPNELINAIIEYMKTEEKIRLAYILKMKNKEQESFLLVVDFIGEKNIVLGSLARVVKPFLTGSISSMDMISLNSELGREALKNAELIYDKENFN